MEPTEAGDDALAVLPAGCGPDPIEVRRARRSDVPAIVALIADDPLGRTRDGADGPGGLGPYLAGFERVAADPNQLLVVAVAAGEVVGTLQLSLLPGVARRGAVRAQIEAVRIGAGHRSHGLGGALVRWAVEEARRRGCALVQLTSDKRRPDAHRFYERLGFVATHEGFKLDL
ncbi:MAG TPA: GNAT family N-acetyltransferase [Acidimicrobiales bacterium]|nr:GNAT family N-acetyltransferase [Acidimicrobiales bacterium]